MPSKNKAAEKSGGRVPAELSDFQRWFSRAASRPLLPGNATRPRGVEGGRLSDEAGARLQSHNGVSGLERLAVYNRQYWFRLITCMQEDFTCAVHVMGLDAFNAWVIRFLDAHPGTSPYLADLDREFPRFLRKKYRARNRARVLEAVAYDKAFARAFEGAPGVPPTDPSRQRLGLAPHVTVLDLNWDFSAYRALCRDDEDLTGRFPLRARRYAVCLYRRDNLLYEKTLSRAEWRVLDALQKNPARPRTLKRLFAALEKETSPRALKAVERGLPEWFRDWTELGIIAAR